MLKNIAKIFTSHIIVKAIGIINIALVLMFFSIENFGNYSFTLLALNLFAITIDPILSSYLIDYKIFNYDKYNFGILIITLVLGFFFYVCINFFIIEVPIFLFFVFSLSYMISAGLKSYLNIKERYYDYGIVDLARQFSIFLTSVIYFYTLNSNNYIELLEFNYLFSSMIMIFLAFVFIKKNEVELSLSINKLKNLVFKSKFLIFYTSLIPVLIFIDSYFVDSYLTEEDLGIYSFSVKIYNISLMLVVPIFTVLNIRQIEIAKEDNYLSFTKENLNKIILFSVVILFLSIFLNWVLVNYLFIDYRESFWITNLLILASFITYITLPFSFLIAYRKYKHLFFLGVIGVSVNIGLNFLLIQKYGMIIAALSTFVSQLISNLGAAIFSYFLLKNKKHED